MYIVKVIKNKYLQDFNMNTSYNNIEIAPTKIIPYKIVYPYIKKNIDNS